MLHLAPAVGAVGTLAGVCRSSFDRQGQAPCQGLRVVEELPIGYYDV